MLGFQLIPNAQPRGHEAAVQSRTRTRGRGGAWPAAVLSGSGSSLPSGSEAALLTETFIRPDIPVTRPTKAIQTQTRRPAAATRDCFQAQKAGSELKSGCLGDSLINSHTTQLRPHSSPVPEAARVQEHGRASHCRAASAEPALRTCTRECALTEDRLAWRPSILCW